MFQLQTLVILSPGFPENENDSTCLPTQQTFILSLKKKHPEIKIIVLAFEYPFNKLEYDWFGIEVIGFGGRNRNRFYRLYNWLRVWQRLKKIIGQNRGVGLLSFWFDECAFIGHYFSKFHKLEHFSWLLGQDARPGNRYFKLVNPKPESLIALSDFIQQTVFDNYGIFPAHTITSGIDTSLYKKFEQLRDIDVLGVGSLIKLKRFDLFIAAIINIKIYYPEIKAVIIGDGPEMLEIQQIIGVNNLQENLILKGEVPHDEVLALMQRTKIFLHTSIYEGFAAVLLEALYAGAHVISFTKPMYKPIKHLHIVKNQVEVQKKLIELLAVEGLDHSAVLPFPVDAAVGSIIELYNQSDKITCSISEAMASKESLSLK